MPARIPRSLLAAITAAVLAGCGGSSGDGGGAEARKEGFWVGANSNGMAGAMVILAHGEVWSLLTRAFDPASTQVAVPGRSYYGSVGFTPESAVRQTRFSGTGNYLTYNDGTDFRGIGAVTGTITAESTVAAQLPDGNTFSGDFRADYDTPVTVASFAGIYAGRAYLGDFPAEFPATLTIGADGVVRQDAGNCTYGGRIQPLTPGRKVHNAEIVPVGICVFFQRSQGVAVLDTGVSPPRLYVMTTYDSKVGGYNFTGVRQ